MKKEDLEIKELVIKSNGKKFAELNHLKVNLHRNDNDEFVGKVIFITDKEVELPEKFNINAIVVTKNKKEEKVYVRDCTECIKIGDNKYQAKC